MATIDRPTLTTWLTNWRGTIATFAGRTLDDTPTGWGPALDAVVAANTANPALPDVWVEPLADYWGLRLVANALDTRVDVMDSGDRVYLSQAADRVRTQLAELEPRVAWLIPGRTSVGVPYAGGLTIDDVTARETDPNAEPAIFTRRTGPPVQGSTGTSWGNRWP